MQKKPTPVGGPSVKGEQPDVPPPPAMDPLPATAGVPETEKAWQLLRSHLGSVSRKAQARLETSRVLSVDNSVATIVFERVSDYDMFMEGKKMKAAVVEIWTAMTGGAIALNFAAAGSGLKMAPVKEVTAVELPLEGEALMQALRQVFEPEQQ